MTVMLYNTLITKLQSQFIRRSVALHILRIRNTPAVWIISNDFKQCRSKEENMENRHSTRLKYL